ncbi:MAG: phosphoribosylformylglycinamidine synthase [Patescibacteria group bacterium]|nr:phosphoribosylformylglycinamidine synthase [Patescibacteria group bacterium]MDD5554672.1 phosphoribosylformylglycinamidine synthase [Patescibacteria group bacterium]
MSQEMYHFYTTPFLSDEKIAALHLTLGGLVNDLTGVRSERVFNVGSDRALTEKELEILKSLLHYPQLHNIADNTFLDWSRNTLEVAPRLNFATSDSTNAVSICQSCGLPSIFRVEQGRRYRLLLGNRVITDEERERILPLLHDKMVECFYPGKLKSFDVKRDPEEYITIPVMERGIEALREANKEYGTGMDEMDIGYYYHLITELLKRNPTLAEFRDLGNSNSEHSRHHVFRAKLIIDGVEAPFTLMELIRGTLKNTANSVIAFHDNSSAIAGYPVSVLIPTDPSMPSPMRMAELLYHFVLTCETHNHPCLWAAYPGAATGGGGRRRDNEDVGRGGIVVAASTGFLGGNLYLPDYPLPWEDPSFKYDPRTEAPIDFFIKATNGAFNDGNEFGEPVILGFAESLGIIIGKERWENIKPVMFTGGFGFIDQRHIAKRQPEKGWYVVKFGGLGYLVGDGGGSASSMIQGQNDADLDFKSVQRADGEMARKADSVIRACIHLGDDNPIEVAHDQGAGGNGNILKELVDPAGAELYLRAIPLGDKTMTVDQIWVAEYQENHGVLVRPENWKKFKAICERYKCPYAIVGVITGDGKVVVIDKKNKTKPIDLKLQHIFGDYPQKTYEDNTRKLDLRPLALPSGLTVRQAQELVFRLMGVASHEWITDKVDRSVTGKVVQQQCVGPLQIPLSNYSIITPGPFTTTGEANSIGQCPSIGLISSESMARMAAARALLKLICVKVSRRDGIKVSANWMLAAKLPGGLAWLYYAAKALHDFLALIGVDVDGGKDSLSMAAKVADEIIRSFGTLVISTYAACPDYRLRLTPDIKCPGESRLMYLDLANGQTRLGGSALAHVLKQVGTECPDADAEQLNAAFDLVQTILETDLLLSGHKRSRGGLVATLSEMAFAGNCGLDLSLAHLGNPSALAMMYNEELGMVFEYLPKHEQELIDRFGSAGLEKAVHLIGTTQREKRIKIAYNGEAVLDEDMRQSRQTWRDTSFHLDLKQTTRSCALAKRKNIFDRVGPNYRLTFDPDLYPAVTLDYPGKPRVAIILEEGSNSDEEMKNAFYLAGFDPWDVHMTDIASGKISLSIFRGVAFVGGFSYKDVLGSAKGWAGVIRYNERVAQEFADFFARPDTFSLGICNGCQLMALLGIVPFKVDEAKQPVFVQNKSERFESGFPNVRIFHSNSIFLKGMEGSVLGAPVAHGEGKSFFPDQEIMQTVLAENLAPIRFVDDYGAPTEDYPLNPNGSPLGITALCDRTGRHLAFMEHPERVHIPYQWHWWPREWKYINSPWLRLFQNAFRWCQATEDLSNIQ